MYVVIILQENLIDEIAKVKDVLPKKQQKLCHYLVMNYEQVGVMTVAELAQAAEVGTTTVMRLVQTLGFPSFSTFKKDLLNAALMRTTTSYQGLKQSFKDPALKDAGDSFDAVISDGIYMLETLGTQSNQEQFERVVRMLLDAERICPLGLRSSRPTTWTMCMTGSPSTCIPQTFCWSSPYGRVPRRPLM